MKKENGDSPEDKRKLVEEIKLLKQKLKEYEEDLSNKEAAINTLILEKQNLEKLSERDTLTGLYNRRGLFDNMRRLKSLIAPKDAKKKRKEGTLEHISVLLLDIDHFKKVNDIYGHKAGDDALIAVSSYLREHLFEHRLREEDIVARWGGEEFIILLPGMNLEEVKDRLIDEKSKKFRHIEVPAIVEGVKIKITLSGGLTDYRHNEDFEHVTVPRADRALLHAKLEGRNKIYVA